MYRVFVVDDEETTRKGIIGIILAQNWDIEVVGEAGDGVCAVDKILREKPDVVITDVKMPIMDGVELASRIREAEPGIKIIFISGYDDTEYMKSALTLDAIDYILKPVNVEELKNVIKKVLNIIDTEMQEKKIGIEMNQKLLQSMPLLKDRFLANLVKNVFQSEAQIEKQVQFLELDLPQNTDYCVMIVQIDDYMRMQEEMAEHDRQLLSFGILNICQELIQNQLSGFIFENNFGEFVSILKLASETENDKLFSLANEIKTALLDYMEIQITVGIGGGVRGRLAIYSSYQSAYTALNHKLYLGKNKIIMFDSTVSNRREEEFRFDNEMLENIRSLLDIADKSKMAAYMEEFFTRLSGCRIDHEFCRNICYQLIILGESVLLKNGVTITGELRAYDRMSEAGRLDTIAEMSRCMIGYFRRVCDALCDLRSNKTTNAVDLVKGIIEESYAENLTISDLAGRVYLTPTYLCLLFRQETGMTINDYLTYVRIQKAKELLGDLKNKIYDISYMVGYANPSYFSLQFKKLVGMGPREYREKM